MWIQLNSLHIYRVSLSINRVHTQRIQQSQKSLFFEAKHFACLLRFFVRFVIYIFVSIRVCFSTSSSSFFKIFFLSQLLSVSVALAELIYNMRAFNCINCARCKVTFFCCSLLSLCSPAINFLWKSVEVSLFAVVNIQPCINSAFSLFFRSVSPLIAGRSNSRPLCVYDIW